MLATEPSQTADRRPGAPRAGDPASSAPGPDQALDRALDRALERARAGDEAGFVELWRALQPPLLRYLRVRGNDSPEDIASETWMQVIRDLAGFAGDAAAFRAWLFTVARHRAIDQARGRTRRPAVPTPEPGEFIRQVVPSAEEQAAAQHATAAALALVATLPPDQAELVMLRVVAGLEVAEVAEIVGKKPGTVRVAVHRALKTLATRPGLPGREAM